MFATPRPAVMVVSHERSGTHFLMNSIARGYGYSAQPWIDLDYSHLPINFFAADTLAATLTRLADQRVASVIKSHHAFEFFDEIIDQVLAKVTIFYIHRDPTAVMMSFWKFINHWRWHEGPRVPDPLAFARAEPEGQLLRYQMKQRRTMLDRWAAHLEGWVKAAEGRPRLRIVRYEHLLNDYAATLSSFADLLGASPIDLTPPPPDVNVVAKRAAVGKSDFAGRAALHKLTLSEVGRTMSRLGYE